MKIVISLIGIICCCAQQGLWAQAMQTAWVATIPGDRYEQSTAVDQSNSGDLYTVGFFQGSLGSLQAIGGEDAFIAKYNDQGQRIWVKNWGSTGTERLNSVKVTGDTCIYVLGEFSGTFYYYKNNQLDSLESKGRLDVLLMKLDSSGQVQWAAGIGGAGNDSGVELGLLPNGNLVLTGYYEQQMRWEVTTITVEGGRDAFLAQVDSLGNLSWLKSLGGPGVDEARSLDVDLAGNIYTTGIFRDLINADTYQATGDLGYDIYMVKYNSQGQAQWLETFGGPTSDQVMTLRVDPQQQIYVAGWYDRSMEIAGTTLQGVQEEDGFVIKFSAAGQLLWKQRLAGDFDERIYELDFDAQANIYVLGTLDSILVLGGDSLTNRHLNRPTDIFLAKYSPSGTYRWAQALGHYYNDFCYDFYLKDATTAYITGSFQDTTIYTGDTLISQADFDVFLAKFELDTTVSIIKIANNHEQTTWATSVAVYPNPWVFSSVLSYQLAKAGTIRLQHLTVDGRQQLLQEVWQDSGSHQIDIDASTWSSGLHWLLLTTDEQAPIAVPILVP